MLSQKLLQGCAAIRFFDVYYMMRYSFFLSILLVGFLVSCSDSKKAKSTKPAERVVTVPVFNNDSAYAFVKRQVDFGPRIPNTDAHRKTGNYLVAQLQSYGAAVTTQDFESPSVDGHKLYLRNIIAAFQPEKTKRILLAAHWDTRPYADKDKENPNAKFEGANDGASGVGVLLEVARVLGGPVKPDVGVDIIFFDGEDWGEREGSANRPAPPEGLQSWWCLGSQYWAKNKHLPNYSAYYGILLDMVGAKNAQFWQEGYSREYAPSIVDKVWGRALQLGYGGLFVRQTDGGITDDHLFVNEIAKIPMINIINHDPQTGSFGSFHHTQDDNMALINKETLGAVGYTVLNVVYHE
jgi:hypothetical protein